MASAFRFNFFDSETTSDETSAPKETSTNKENSKEDSDQSASFGEIAIPKDIDDNCSKKNISPFRVSDDLVLNLASQPKPNETGLHVSEVTDVVSNVYEGGFKIWECTRYLSQFLLDRKVFFENSCVAELGCGCGIPGILALVLGAKMTVFQDFNKEVLEHWTISNVAINAKDENARRNVKFFYGDWGKLAECDHFCSPKFDIILMSETIYVTSSYPKLKTLIAKCLGENGTVYMAAKSYYFGTGGSVLEFSKYMNSTHSNDPHRFLVQTEQEFNEGVRCSICSIRWNND